MKILPSLNKHFSSFRLNMEGDATHMPKSGKLINIVLSTSAVVNLTTTSLAAIFLWLKYLH